MGIPNFNNVLSVTASAAENIKEALSTLGPVRLQEDSHGSLELIISDDTFEDDIELESLGVSIVAQSSLVAMYDFIDVDYKEDEGGGRFLITAE